MKKKTVVLILALVLVCTVFAFPASAAEDAPVTVLEEDSLTSFISSLNTNDYGGVYMDSGSVHILADTPEDEQSIQSKFNRSRASKDNKVTFSSGAKYTIAELNEEKSSLLAQHDALNITAIGLNGRANALAVYLPAVTEEAKAVVRKASSIDNILFRNDSGLNFEELTDEPPSSENSFGEDASSEALDNKADLTIRGGNHLFADGDVKIGTLATQAVYDYNGPDQMNGFITHGHYWNVGQNVYYGGTKIGTVKKVWMGDTLDIAFIQSTYQSDGYIENGLQLTSRGAPISDAEVSFYGGESGENSGTVLDTSIDGNWGNDGVSIYYSDLFTIDGAVPIKYDSGAPIYEELTRTTGKIIGVAKGTASGGTLGVGVNIVNIKKYANITPST